MVKITSRRMLLIHVEGKHFWMHTLWSRNPNYSIFEWKYKSRVPKTGTVQYELSNALVTNQM